MKFCRQFFQGGLPVAPLLRFRCVSKLWKSLIEDEHFIKQHLTRSQKTNSNLNVILQSYYLYSVDFELPNETMAAFKELSHPLIEARCGRTRILGSCDGLLVLRNDQNDVTVLWNPSVRRFYEIPFCGTEYLEYNTYSSYGFGYDVVSDDYKLIRIFPYYVKDEDKFNFAVKVYSLKSDSWRRIPDSPYYIRADGVLANDALHWIVRRNKLVAAFDLGTEEFRLVPLPKFAGDGNIVTLVVLGGCLSLSWQGKNARHFDIWVMKEYGVQKSWSILFTVGLGELKTPLAYSKCGRKVLLGLGGDVLCYDLDKKSTDDVPMVRLPSNFRFAMFTCLQSLVLLNNGTCDFDLVAKKKLERQIQKL